MSGWARLSGLICSTSSSAACQMLPVHRHRIWRTLNVMEPKSGKKSRDVLRAIAAGRSCEQILAGDGTLTYHDIFHVVTEAPTSFWKKASLGSTGKGLPSKVISARTPARHRRD